MAPEQAENTHSAAAPADIYSLGCTLFYLLTGRSVYNGENLMQRLLAHRDQPIPSLLALNPNIPAEVDAIFLRMVAKRPADRFATMNDVVVAIEHCQNSKGDAAAPSVSIGGTEDSRLDAFLQSLPTQAQTASATLNLVTAEPTAVSTSPQEAATIVTAGSAIATQSLSVGISAALTPGARARTRHTPRGHRGQWLGIAAGAFGILLLGVIVITITRKDGTVTQFEVPEDTKVEISHRKSQAQAASTSSILRPSTVVADPFRQAAEAVLGIGGEIKIFAAAGTKTVREIADLPNEPFSISEIAVTNSPASWATITPAIVPIQESLTALRITNCPFSDADLIHLDRLDAQDVVFMATQITDRSAPVLAKWRRVIHLDLGKSPVGNEVCAVLAKWPCLSALTLNCRELTPAGIVALGNCAHLTILSLPDCTPWLVPEFASLVKLPNLRQFLVSYNVGDEAINVLSEGTGLSQVYLTNSRVSAEGAQRLQAALPQANIIHNAVQINTDEADAVRWAVSQRAGVRGVQARSDNDPEQNHSAVQSLTFPDDSPSGTEAVRLVKAHSLSVLIWPNLKNADQAMQHLTQNRNLENFCIQGSDVTVQGLAHLVSLPQLRQLMLNDSKTVDDEGLSQLPELPSLWLLYLKGYPLHGSSLQQLAKRTPLLQRLDLSRTKITSESLRQLVPLRYLRYLYVESTSVDDTAVPHLSQCAGLQFLNVRGTNITREGAERLRSALPFCSINWNGGFHPPSLNREISQPAE